MLESDKCEVDIVTKLNQTALTLVCSGEGRLAESLAESVEVRSQIAQLLIDKNCNVNIADFRERCVPLHHAAMNGELEMISILTRSGRCEMHCQEVHGRTGVNFINILRTNFSYERHFGSFF